MILIIMLLLFAIMVLVARYRFRYELDIREEQTQTEIFVGLALLVLLVFLAMVYSDTHEKGRHKPEVARPLPYQFTPPATAAPAEVHRPTVPAAVAAATADDDDDNMPPPVVVTFPKTPVASSGVDDILSGDTSSSNSLSSTSSIWDSDLSGMSSQTVSQPTYTTSRREYSPFSSETPNIDSSPPIETSPRPSTSSYVMVPTTTIHENALGPGVHQDSTGQPVRYHVPNWPANEPTQFLQVQQNVLGPGVGMDQVGRPVTTRPAF